MRDIPWPPRPYRRTVALITVLAVAALPSVLPNVASASGCLTSSGGSWLNAATWGSSGVIPGVDYTSDMGTAENGVGVAACVSGGTVTFTPGTIHSEDGGAAELQEGALALVQPASLTITDHGEVEILGESSITGSNEVGTDVVFDVSSDVTTDSSGELLLEPTDQTDGYPPSDYPGAVGASVELDAGSFENSGTLEIDNTSAGTWPAYLGDANYSGTFTNEATGNVEATGSGMFDLEAGDTFTNQGSWNIGSGVTESLLNASCCSGSASPSKFVNDGSYTDAGTTSVNNNEWDQTGGSLSGSTISLVSGKLIDSAGSGGSFLFLNGGSGTLSGTIPASQSVEAQGNYLTLATASGVAGVSNRGTLQLDDPSGQGGAAMLGSELDNYGSLDVTSENGLTPVGSVYGYRVYNNVVNEGGGTLEVKSGELNMIGPATFTNNGTWQIDSTADMWLPAVGCCSGGTNTFTNDGAYVNAGSTQVNHVIWNQEGGALEDNPLDLNGTTLNDIAGSGILQFTGGGSFTGSIPSGQRVEIPSGQTVTAPSGLSIAGGRLDGSGTVNGNVSNAGTIEPMPSPATLTISGNYTQTSGGILAVSVTPAGADATKINGTAKLAGTLQITTASGFSPTSGTIYSPVQGTAVQGTFGTVSGLGSGPYVLSYGPTFARLTVGTAPPGSGTTTTTQKTTAKPAHTVVSTDIDNQHVTLTLPYTGACLAPSTLQASLKTAPVKGSKKTALTFARAVFALDSGRLKHVKKETKKVKVGGKTVTKTVDVATYTSLSATLKHASGSVKIKLTGVAKGAHALHVTIIYNHAVVVGRRKQTRTVTKRLTERLRAC